MQGAPASSMTDLSGREYVYRCSMGECEQNDKFATHMAQFNGWELMTLSTLKTGSLHYGESHELQVTMRRTADILKGGICLGHYLCWHISN